MCLSIVLLVNKFHYRLIQKVKYNIRYKTFLCCTREMNISWKLLFYVSKRNYFVTKLSVDPYLVKYISWIYVYVCTYLYHKSARKLWRMCISSFPCYFGDWQLLNHSIYILYLGLIRPVYSIYNSFPFEVSVLL